MRTLRFYPRTDLAASPTCSKKTEAINITRVTIFKSLLGAFSLSKASCVSINR